MITDTAQPFQSYLETTVTKYWAEWAKRELSSVIPEAFVAAGFQDLVASTNADDRTRELEFFRLGFLRGRLIRDRDMAGDEQPEGWRLWLKGESPMTHDGALAATIGIALKSSTDEAFRGRLRRALSLIGFTVLLQWGLNLGGQIVSQALVFRYVLQRTLAAVPRTISESERLTIHRYVSQAVNNTLDSPVHAIQLLKDYTSNVPAPSLVFVYQNQSTISKTVLEIAKEALLDPCTLPKFEDLYRQKASLYWATERGLYGNLLESDTAILDSLVMADQQRLASGGDCVLGPAILADFNSPASGFVRVQEAFKMIPSISVVWSGIMKSVYDITLEALVAIRPHRSEGVTHFYPHGTIEQSLSGATLRIPIAEVPIKPNPNDFVVHAHETLLVLSVTEQGNELLITVQ